MRLGWRPRAAAVRAEVEAQAGRWVLWAPVAFGLGCAVYFGLRFEPPLWLPAALALSLFALSAVASRHGRNLARIVLTLAALAALGAGAARLRTVLVAGPVIAERGVRDVDAFVVDVASPGVSGGRLVLAPYRIEGVAADGLPDRMRITVDPQALAGPGSAIRVKAILGPSPGPASPGAYDFARDAFYKRIGAVGFALGDPQLVDGPRPPFTLRVVMAVNAWRWSLSRRIVEDLGPRVGGIAAAMVTGHEAWLERADEDAMRDAGLAHVLSISGLHMAIVGGFVFFLVRTLIAAWPWLALRVPGKKLAAIAGLIATVIYLITSGAPSPAVRSATTLAVAFIAILADRQAISLRSLAVAAMAVLILQPEAVVHPGFQMSFAATAALVALAEAWPRPVREIEAPWIIRAVQGAMTWIGLSLLISLVAGLATGPFAIQHFNRVALYGLPANLLLAPLSSFVIMPALAAGAVGEALGHGGPFIAIAGAGIRAMLWIAETAAQLPGAVMTVASAPAWTLPVAFVGLLWVCLWQGKMRWLGVPAALAVSLCPRPAPPAAWIAADGGAAALVAGREAILLRPDAKRFAADLWARRRDLSVADNAEAARAAVYDCNRSRCLPLQGPAPRIAAWWTKRPPRAGEVVEACAGADIVILKRAETAEGCRAPLVLTPADFERGGAAEIYRAGDGWRVVWANSLRGVRPWAVGGTVSGSGG